MSRALSILPKLHQSKLPHQLPPKYKTLNPPSHHQNPNTPMITKPLKILTQFKKCKHVEQCETCDTMRGCGLTSLMVCSDDITCDMRERNVTISEI